MKLKQTAGFVLQSINYLFWPGVCINCAQSISESDGVLCGDCWRELLAGSAGGYCSRCGKDVSGYSIVQGNCPNCQSKEIYFDRIARAGVYTDALRKMILSFKNGRTELNKTLSFLADSALQGSGFNNDIDFFTPVPLHWSRRLFRGYNQAYLIAKKLSQRPSKINTDLVRIRRTKEQTQMSSEAARAKNVAGAFAVRRGHHFADRKICLIDDIKTSGATLNECAKILKQAGASKVYALVLSVAGQDGKN